MFLKERYYFKPQDGFQLDEIKKDLTFFPLVNYEHNMKNPVFAYEMKGDLIAVPRYYGFNKFGNLNNIQLTEGIEINVTFIQTLKPHQVEASKKIINNFNSLNPGGKLQMPCGFGKTGNGIYIISVVQRKTLVLLHNSGFIKQWEDEVNFFLGPNVRTGKICQKECDIKDKDIVFAMIQTLVRRPNIDLSSFGLVIIDEMHHIVARTFIKSILMMSPKYILGLSATPRRTDGLTKLLDYYIGPTLFSIQRDFKKDNVLVKILSYKNGIQDEPVRLWKGKTRPDVVKMITQLSKDKYRTYCICLEIWRHFMEENRKILILSQRTDQLKWMKQWFEEIANMNGKIGMYLGQNHIKKSLLEEQLKCPIILASYTMAKEGLNCPKLDTLVFATPLSKNKDISEQCIGRILRSNQNKERPCIIYIRDPFGTFDNRFKEHKKLFNRWKYDIIEDYLSGHWDNCKLFPNKLENQFKTKFNDLKESLGEESALSIIYYYSIYKIRFNLSQ